MALKEETRPETARSGSKDSAEVTYIPDDGDPNKVVWNGIEFRANVPVTISHSKMVSSLTRVESKGPEGELRSRGVEGTIAMVELARKNPSFSVDGEQAQRRAATQRLPTDSDQYRGYALRWIRESTSLSQLNERWDGEHELRERCGFEKKDEAYLRPFLDARKEQVGAAA